jgi:LCP family protein required for cell wall assembly
MVMAPPGSTATPTPFMPIGPTSTYIPTDYPTPEPTSTRTPVPTATYANPWGAYAGPTVWPDVDVPYPVGLIDQPDNQVNILLLGSDQRPDDYGFRTDTIMLVTINTDLGTANITSFPRDLYVYIPGWTVQRINTAFPHGGFSLMQDTFEYNFGVRPDYYALISFQAFKSVIDNVGGIDVYVNSTLTDQRDGYGDYYTIYAGSNHMDGETALWYVRSRHSSSDFERTQRQQEVILGLFNRFMRFDIVTRAPQLYDTYRSNVDTNLTIENITPLLTTAAQLSDTSRIHHYYISRTEVVSYRTSTGAAVLLPLYDQIYAIMKQALNVE